MHLFKPYLIEVVSKPRVEVVLVESTSLLEWLLILSANGFDSECCAIDPWVQMMMGGTTDALRLRLYHVDTTCRCLFCFPLQHPKLRRSFLEMRLLRKLHPHFNLARSYLANEKWQGGNMSVLIPQLPSLTLFLLLFSPQSLGSC